MPLSRLRSVFSLAERNFQGVPIRLDMRLSRQFPIFGVCSSWRSASLRIRLCDGENLLLSAIGACTLCLFRVLLCVAVYGRKMMQKTGRLPDTVSARVLLCAIVTLGFSLIEIIRAGTELSDILFLAVNTVCAASFSFFLLFSLNRSIDLRRHLKQDWVPRRFACRCRYPMSLLVRFR